MKPETETKKRRERLKGMINNAETNRAFDLLRAEDSESQIAQRYLAVLANMCSDAGGLDRCTEVRLQLIRRFSALAVHAELMDSKFIAGKDVDVLRYAVISSTLCRSRIGMKPAVKQVPYPLSIWRSTPTTSLSHRSRSSRALTRLIHRTGGTATMASDDPPLTLDDDDIPAEVVQELNDQLDAFGEWYHQQILKALADQAVGKTIIINDDAYWEQHSS